MLTWVLAGLVILLIFAVMKAQRWYAWMGAEMGNTGIPRREANRLVGEAYKEAVESLGMNELVMMRDPQAQQYAADYITKAWRDVPPNVREACQRRVCEVNGVPYLGDLVRLDA